MNTTTLDGVLFTSMVRGGSVNLKRNRNIVNDLNVFPIPDGDTGDNMYMTVEAGYTAAVGENSASLDTASSSVAKGMLLGARGNSGVILSRIFAGIADSFAGCRIADVNAVACAFSEGIKQAYSAVNVPVEGTILTVYRKAVEFANSNITVNTSLQDYFCNFTDELRRTLDKTPDMLDVLKEAGVVDSGGAGFVYIAEGMKKVLDGDDDYSFELSEKQSESKKTPDISLFTENSVMTFGYCTEFLLRLQNSKTDIMSFDIDKLTEYLTSVGDSVVSFIDGSIVKVHVHTMMPGNILNYCQRFGEFLTVKIENMTVQHSESDIKNNYTPKKKSVRKKYAVIPVACGKGMTETFKQLGADLVVSGGQSMNPSAKDFIKAFEKVNADTIFVLPNNSNILLTAKQAASLYDKSDVRVIESHTIGDGYAALSMLDYSSDNTDEIFKDASNAMENVVTGEVSKAVRDSVVGGVKVSAGDYLGFVGSKIYANAATCTDAAKELASALDAKSRDVVIIICGESVSDQQADEVYNYLQAKYKKTEFIMQDGGQAVYDFIMIFE